MDDAPRHIVAVMGLVTDPAGRVLLVRTGHRGWEPPGGQVERGEDLIAALKREIREESGCEVDVSRLVGVYSNVGAPPKVMFTFLCSFARGEACAGAECSEAGWFSPEEALRMVTHPAQLAKLHDALAPEGIVYRAYRTVSEAVPEGVQRYARYEVLAERPC